MNLIKNKSSSNKTKYIYRIVYICDCVQFNASYILNWKGWEKWAKITLVARELD